jgi:SAM-dependent methyltransferase
MNKFRININAHTEDYIDELLKDSSFEAVLSNARKKQVLRSMDLYQHNSILEIGCGLNPLFTDINDYEEYTIVEPSKKFTEFARALEKNGRKITIINGFLEEIFDELKNSRFDFIFLSGVLHHVSLPAKFLSIIYKLCNTNSVVHINVPNAYSFHRLLALEMGYIKTIFDKSETNARMQTNWIFDKDSLIRLVQDNEFDVLDFGTYFIKLFTNEQVEKIIAENILRKEAIKGLENMIKYIPDMGCEMFVNLRPKEKQKRESQN